MTRSRGEVKALGQEFQEISAASVALGPGRPAATRRPAGYGFARWATRGRRRNLGPTALGDLTVR